MANIRPFSALRPKPELAARICELPYDVMSSAEAREIVRDNPLSFLHVSKPEIDLPAQIDPYDLRVYAHGKENFAKLIRDGTLRQDEQPYLYLYRQVMGQHSQVGVVAAASCEDYLRGVIKKHELTRPDKEDDRVRHIETLNSQTGPAFLTYRADPGIDEFVSRATGEIPEIDFTAADRVRHTAWVLENAEDIAFLQSRFARIPNLYIADGHHRSAAAARVYHARNGAGSSDYFLSVIFPHNQIQILAYNRVLKDLNGMTAAGLLQKLEGIFIVKQEGSGRPARRHELGLYLEGRWHTLFFREHFVRTKDPIERLDATLLQRFVLDPVFGIDDSRTSKRINFVGGIRGTAELEKLVTSGEYACAFAMFPTSIEELMTIADLGGIMPPKSTWFEPKLRDGMFCHMLG